MCHGQVLQGVPDTQCIFDNMIIAHKTDEEHLENLVKLLDQLQDAGLKANKEKCEFSRDRVQFCGHEIDSEGLLKLQEKIEPVANVPRPENVLQLRSFLRLINSLLQPRPAQCIHSSQHQLLEQDSEWQWTEQCEQAFTEAKCMITSEQVLTHHYPALPVRLACDALPTGISAVLSIFDQDRAQVCTDQQGSVNCVGR